MSTIDWAHWVALSHESEEKVSRELVEYALVHMNSDNEREFIDGVNSLWLQGKLNLQFALVVAAGSDNLIRKFAEISSNNVIIGAMSHSENRMRQIIRAIGDGEKTYTDFVLYLSFWGGDFSPDTSRKILKMIRDENNIDPQLRHYVLDELYPIDV